MPRFQVRGSAQNLTPPATPIRVHGIGIEKGPAPGLDQATLDRLAQYLTLPLRFELFAAVQFFQHAAADVVLDLEIEGADFEDAQDKAKQEFMKLLMAIELRTVKATVLGGGFSAGPAGETGRGWVVSYGTRKAYRGGKASIESAMIPGLEEVLDMLDSKPPSRIETAMLEFDTALKSDDP